MNIQVRTFFKDTFNICFSRHVCGFLQALLQVASHHMLKGEIIIITTLCFAEQKEMTGQRSCDSQGTDDLDIVLSCALQRAWQEAGLGLPPPLPALPGGMGAGHDHGVTRRKLNLGGNNVSKLIGRHFQITVTNTNIAMRWGKDEVISL